MVAWERTFSVVMSIPGGTLNPGGIVQRPKVSWQHELQQTAQYDGRNRRPETKKQLHLHGLGVGFKPNIPQKAYQKISGQDRLITYDIYRVIEESHPGNKLVQLEQNWPVEGGGQNRFISNHAECRDRNDGYVDRPCRPTFDRSAARERWEANNFVHPYYVNARTFVME